MKRGSLDAITKSVIVIFWIGFFQSTFAQTDIEKKKIEFLLHEVEQLKGAKFWRNGSFYSPKQATDHLRMKWSKAGSAVKTAKDFIDKIASKSSMSGKAYEIEFADGKKINTSTFFYQKLSAWKE